MHIVGRGALDIWMRMTIRDVTRKENGSREVRENLRADIKNVDFTISRATHFNAVKVTPGVLCMFILHHMITTA